VFPINHRLQGLELLRIRREVIAAVPDWWIGLNRLDVPSNEVFSNLSSGVSGVWVDNAMIREGQSSQRKTGGGCGTEIDFVGGPERVHMQQGPNEMAGRQRPSSRTGRRSDEIFRRFANMPACNS